MMSDKTPLVSICIPTYNGEAYIAEAMASAIAQTYPALEIIISDDDSQDNTLNIIEAFKDQTEIPISIFNHKPCGIGNNWNNCVKQANGYYIKFLFQDDVLLPRCIELMIDLAQSAPNIGLVYCRRHFIHELLTPKIQKFKDFYDNLHMYWQDIKVEEGIISGRLYLKDKELLNSPKNKIGEPTAVLLRKDVFGKIGFFNETLKQTLDCEFWYRAMKHYNVGFVDAILVKFRLHEQQASHINKIRHINETPILYRLYYKHLFWQLHPKNCWKLLKLYHPLIKKLVDLKRLLHV